MECLNIWWWVDCWIVIFVDKLVLVKNIEYLNGSLYLFDREYLKSNFKNCEFY